MAQSQSKDSKKWLTKTLGEVGLLVHKDLGGDNGAEGEEGLVEVRVGELGR